MSVPSVLVDAVRADVAEQYRQWCNGTHGMAYNDSEPWSSYVEVVGYWEFGGRGEMTSEYISERYLGNNSQSRHPRLVGALRDVWFAAARALVWSAPDPATALSFDECE